MSREIFKNDDVSVVEFWGGYDRGVCIQITPLKSEFSQLELDDVCRLILALNQYTFSERVRVQDLMTSKIRRT